MSVTTDKSKRPKILTALLIHYTQILLVKTLKESSSRNKVVKLLYKGYHEQVTVYYSGEQVSVNVVDLSGSNLSKCHLPDKM